MANIQYFSAIFSPASLSAIQQDPIFQQLCSTGRNGGHIKKIYKNVYSARLSRESRLVFSVEDNIITLIDFFESHDAYILALRRKILPYLKRINFIPDYELGNLLETESASDLNEAETNQIAGFFKQNTRKPVYEPAHWILNQLIILTEDQKRVKFSRATLVSGVPGSGKTSTLLQGLSKAYRLYCQTDSKSETETEVIQQFLYLTNTESLSTDVQNHFNPINDMTQGSRLTSQHYEAFAQKVDPSLTLADPTNPKLFSKTSVGKKHFDEWFSSSKIQSDLRKHSILKHDTNHNILCDTLQKEFGIISGYDKEEDYLNLGERDSFFEKDLTLRKYLYKLYKHYIAFLEEHSCYDLRFYDLRKAIEQYKKEHPETLTAVLDEIQNFSRAQLLNIFHYIDIDNTKNSVQLSMDNNQKISGGIVSSRDFICQFFREKNITLDEYTLTDSHRIPKNVAVVINHLLDLQAKHEEGVYDNKTYKEIVVVNKKEEGNVIPVPLDKLDTSIYKEKCQSPDYAVVIPDESLRKEASDKFGTKLVFTVEEIIGRQYLHIIFYKGFNKQQAKFLNPLCTLGGKDIIPKHRPKDKSKKQKQDLQLRNTIILLSRASKSLTLVFDKHEENIIQYCLQNVTLEPSSAECLKDIGSTPEEKRAKWIKEAKSLLQENNAASLEKVKGIMAQHGITHADLDVNEDFKPIVKAIKEQTAPQLKAKSLLESASKQDHQKVEEPLNTIVVPTKVNPTPKKARTAVEFANGLLFNFTKENINNLLNSSESMMQKLLFDMLIQDRKNLCSTKLSLLEQIFSDEARTILFFEAVDTHPKSSTIMSILKKNQALASLIIKKSEYTLLCASEKVRHIKAFQEHLSFAGIYPDLEGTYADAQYALGLLYLKNDTLKTEATHLFRLHKVHKVNKEMHLQREALIAAGKSTRLHDAMLYNYPTPIKTLILDAGGVDVRNAHSATALHIAVIKGLIQRTNELLVAGANVNSTNNDGDTPIHLAARHGHAEIINTLIALKINVNTPGNQGNTPLHFAILHGQNHLIPILIAAGANIENVNDAKQTPLHIATYYNKDATTFSMLITPKTINARNANGESPLHFAAATGSVEKIATLIANGAIIDMPTTTGETPLYSAMHQKQTDAIIMLAQALGENLNALDSFGNSAVHFAVIHKYYDLIPTLKMTGMNLNTLNREGDTPLHTAVYIGDIQTINTLIVENVYRNIVNNLGFTPLTLAENFEAQEIVTIIKNANNMRNAPTPPILLDKKPIGSQHINTQPVLKKMPKAF